MSVQETLTSNTGADAQGRRLESWKEIATYLGREVTTVRRWEKREGLPVHRLHHSRLGSVYAYTAELDAWRGDRAPAAATDAPDARHVSEVVRRRPPVRTAAGFAALALALTAVLIWLVRERTTIQPASASGGIRSLAVLPLQNFSGNPEHDYPTTIIYRKQPDGSLFARVEGKQKGKLVGEDFSRVDGCAWHGLLLSF